MSASVGIGRSSIAPIRPMTVELSSLAWVSSMPMKTSSSAPAEKSSPSALRSRARMSLPAASSTAARKVVQKLRAVEVLRRIVEDDLAELVFSLEGHERHRGVLVAGVGRVVLRVLGLEPVAPRFGVDGVDALERELSVVGLHDLSPGHVLDLERRLQVRVGSHVECPLRVRNRHRGQACDLLCKSECTCGSVLDEFVDEAELEC